MTPDFERGGARLYCGDNAAILPLIPTASVDAIVTDPPYPCIDRPYGYWTEEEWFAMMRFVVPECMRILKPTGSAVFILQPNSERVGRMRTWLWEFMVWVGKEWGIVQDAYQWNPSSPPTVHVHSDNGLMRPSVTNLVWIGRSDCYRDQESVLWTEAQSSRARYACARAGLAYTPSGHHGDLSKAGKRASDRGGKVTPFNMLPIANTDANNSAGAHGHGAGTPMPLCRWWTRYICPPGGTVLDPFLGSGTMALAALAQDKQAIGIERVPEYHAIAVKRVNEALDEFPLYEPPGRQTVPATRDLFASQE